MKLHDRFMTDQASERNGRKILAANDTTASATVAAKINLLRPRRRASLFAVSPPLHLADSYFDPVKLSVFDLGGTGNIQAPSYRKTIAADDVHRCNLEICTSPEKNSQTRSARKESLFLHIMMPPGHQSKFHRAIDLASERNGGLVLAASDDFFAPKENLIKASEPQFIPGKYTDRGKWMDGWESRRRRTPGNDWCVVKLGYRGLITGVIVDTSHFDGNHPEEATIDAADVPEGFEPAEGDWTQILQPVSLEPDAPNVFEVGSDAAWTHVRLNIFPDGGVARLQVFGVVVPDWQHMDLSSPVELSSVALGGRAVDCSGEHFAPVANLVHPSEPVNMGDGWETARRRGPGHDWAIIALGRPGILSRVDVDTTHFKGNFPESCSLDGAFVTAGGDLVSAEWRNLIGRTVLQADQSHHLEVSGVHDPVSHVRLNIFPDGGVARLRVFGRPASLSDHGHPELVSGSRKEENTLQ